MAKLAGNSDVVTLDSAAGAKTLQSFSKEESGGPRAALFMVRADSGNSASILVGANRKANFPLAKTDPPVYFANVDPGEFAFDSQGVASLKAYYAYAGESVPDTEAARRFPKREDTPAPPKGSDPE